MRRTATNVVVLAAIAALAGLGCAEDSQEPTPTGSGGTGGIDIIGPGGNDQPGGAGGDGGTGGSGGEGGEQTPTFRIDAIHPSYGPVDGGTRVTITGSGFVSSVPDETLGASTVVYFGDNPSIDARVVDDRTILATSPVGVVGEVDVTVRNSSGEQVCARCFRYLPALDLRAVEPNAGPVEGGSRVILRGEGLTEDVTVLFGSRAAMDLDLLPDGSLSVLVPPGDEPGLVDVRVFAPARQSLLRRAFRYRAPLRVDTIEPPFASMAGGDSVVILGEGFTSSTRVRFGDVEAFAQVREYGLEAVVPAAAAPGAVRVEVYDGETIVSHPFAYVDATRNDLELYAVVPERGSTEGGTEVALLGSGLDGNNLAVYFGETIVEEVEVESPHLARVTTPPGTAGPTEVRVRTAEGMDALPNGYVYVPTREIFAVDPPMGSVEGGTPVRIFGRNFPQQVEVFVGALQATSVVRVDDTRIDVVTPPGSEGAVPVRVIDANDPSTVLLLRNAFRYEGPLSLAVVDPPTGARAGGTRVLVRGSGFRGAMQVFFGPNEAEEVTVLDPFTLEVYTPKGNVGLVDLRLVRDDGEEVTLEGGFNYFAPSSGYGGSAGGPLNGVLNVTVIARSGPDENLPIEGCTVYVGADGTGLLTKTTDARGEVTFSSPSLVKAVHLSVNCPNYEIATVSNQVSENVTLLLDYNGPAEQQPPDDQIEVPTSKVAGRIHGFKLPPNRVLGPTEEAVALVSIAYPSVYSAPPFGDPMPFVTIPFEGGMFLFQFRGGAYLTLYATFGVLDTVTQAFEPLLFGYARGITVQPGEEVTDVEIVLDTRLDQEVPVTILGPAWGLPGRTEVTAFLDLGADGVIPLATAFNEDDPEHVVLTHMPRVTGDNLIFFAWGHEENFLPFTIAYRRQAGDVSQGVTVGPLLGQPDVLQPGFVLIGDTIIRKLNGVFEWRIDATGDEPDVVYIDIYVPGMNPGERTSHWHMVVPGSERRVVVPQEVVQTLRDRLGSSPVRVDIIGGKHPTFDFPEWNYPSIGLANFTAFTITAFMMIP